MRKEDLQGFTEEQLLKYLGTFKKRVKEMRQLTVQLQKQNVDLSAEYTSLVNKKKILYKDSLTRKGFLLKWYSSGKESVSGWINKLHKQQSNSYEPKLQNQAAAIQHQPSLNQHNSPEKGADGLNLQHLYSVSKQRIGGLIEAGGIKIKQYTAVIKQKYESVIKSPDKNSETHPNTLEIDQRRPLGNSLVERQ